MHGTVVVTGGAAGLGAVIADTVLAKGRGVLLVDRDQAAAAATSNELEARHGSPVPVVDADLSTVEAIHAAADSLLERPDITALVNNAGDWSIGAQYPDADPGHWLAALTLDLIAPMLLTQRLWPRLAAAHGAVVNIGSSAGEGDEPYASPEYGAAKAAIRRYTSSLGDRADVRVMAVVPGWIGLERARRQFAALTLDQQRAAGPLIPPQQIADHVQRLLERGRAGEIVELLG
ncbi:SDR family NAD(P)-dependent oxidoreductase [Agromyces ramosus]|uniref:NAD(P)-dependent dehydrogenase (Short-subunit alcohol dehydrogenase family) n=1 Tax=Agromyces ramosus TaxID=33879 RepID=A0ABU0RA56_9MICO|nr:SDR family oxidoreductase [Agromyces ramosus]MDQ0894960.1 NAD(P)-dependent dehydrogenase (short-subunit alcohol dehydrogenase family) [Agromyces ramosus]